LGDFERVGQTGVVKAKLPAGDNLCLAGQTAESARIEDAVAVAGELAPRIAAAARLDDATSEREGVVGQVGSG
jgi:hypothetical protein